MGALRLVLALSVVAWHIPGAPLRLINAAAAVAGFFIVSGFYMAMVINEKYKLLGPGWRRSFYLARVLRIYPPYLVMLGIMIIWFGIRHIPTPFFGNLPIAPSQHLEWVFANVTLFGLDTLEAIAQGLRQHSMPAFMEPVVALFHPRFFQENYALVGQAWSLSSEVCFYLIAPFLVVSIRRCFAALVVALVIRAGLIGGLDLRSGVWGYWFFPATASLFLLGSAGYHLSKAVALPKLALRGASLAAVIGLVVWLAFAVWRDGAMLAPVGEASIDKAPFWLFYIGLAVFVPGLFALTKRSRLDRAMGDLSYPLYLSHALVSGVAYYDWHAPRGVLIDELAVVCLCLVAAYALRVAVDDKIDAWRVRFAERVVSRHTPSCGNSHALPDRSERALAR